MHAQPGAKGTAIDGLHGDALKVRVQAPPVEGRANEVLAAFLAERFGVPRARVSLLGGEKSRAKRFRVRGSKVHPLALLDQPETKAETRESTEPPRGSTGG